jgi:hypothetical protein
MQSTKFAYYNLNSIKNIDKWHYVLYKAAFAVQKQKTP